MAPAIAATTVKLKSDFTFMTINGLLLENECYFAKINPNIRITITLIIQMDDVDRFFQLNGQTDITRQRNLIKKILMRLRCITRCALLPIGQDFVSLWLNFT